MGTSSSSAGASDSMSSLISRLSESLMIKPVKTTAAAPMPMPMPMPMPTMAFLFFLNRK
ncbi:hypothetical protein [Streptomyces sp. NPDC001070]